MPLSYSMGTDSPVGEGIRCDPVDFSVLPEGCISSVLSFTNPREACRLSSVSKIFKSAAESDAVWEKFLPPDYETLIPPSLGWSSKKELYLSLCDNPILIEDGKKSFWLEKPTGKKCYMISARELLIVWGDTPIYWRWTSLPEARFEEVAELINVCWLEIRGSINTSILSPKTLYTAYLVFKTTTGVYGFEYQSVEVIVGLAGSEGCKKKVYLAAETESRRQHLTVPRRFGLFNSNRLFGLQRSAHTRQEDGQYPNVREDGWLEIELGEFFNNGDVGGELELSILEVEGGGWKSGLIVQGIEIRPKKG